MTKIEACKILIEMQKDIRNRKKLEALEIALDSMNGPSDVMICRDCKYWKPCELTVIKRTGTCTLHNMFTVRSYYCADGEVSQ